jgi:hypothetical protein
MTTQPTGRLLRWNLHPLEKCCYGLHLRSTGITPLHHYSGPLRHPLIFGRFPGVPVIRPTLLRWFPSGMRRGSPVAQRVLVSMPSLPPRQSGPPRQPVCDGPYCLRLSVAGSASGAAHFRGHRCVRLRYSLETRPHPEDEAVERLQRVSFPSPCAPSYRALAFPLVGLPPTEHASLRWTHNRTGYFRIIRLSRKRDGTNQWC